MRHSFPSGKNPTREAIASDKLGDKVRSYGFR